MRIGAPIAVDPALPAMLLIAVHAEEEFDWSRFDREATGVRHAAALPRLQGLFDAAGARPTYFMDYPFATQAASRDAVAAAVAAGRAHVGTHLHPWVSPPHEETVGLENSYPGNLPAALEAAKLRVLSDAIAQGFGQRPRAYLAGRYGIGPNTATALGALGYDLDLSLSPTFDYSADHGPDFSTLDNSPRRAADVPGLVHLPHTVGHVGALCRGGRPPFQGEPGPLARAFRIGGILARLGAARRVRLSPEGFSVADMRALTQALHDAGQRLFVFSLHSPSIMPGGTPYAADAAAVDALFGRIQGYLDWFLGALGGRVIGPTEARAALDATHA